MYLTIRVILASMAFAAGAALGHDVAPDAGDLTLTAHELTRYLHVVLLVFWLGPEFAIMIAGNHAVDLRLTPSQRAAAARMMRYYELLPRICMSLMLTVGGILSEQIGLDHPWWQAAAIWLLGPVWLVLTLAAYFGAGPGQALADRLELALRVALIVGIPVSVAWSTSTGRLEDAPYVGAKLILFALILLLGLLARRALRPFREGVRQIAREGTTSAQLDTATGASFRRARPLVLGTWAALLVAALLGIVQPGVAEEDADGSMDEHAALERSA